jgi:hypothetical protein
VPIVTPLTGRAAGRAKRVDGADVAIVVDAEGLYLMTAEDYLALRPGRPLLRRRELADRSRDTLRSRLLDALADR